MDLAGNGVPPLTLPGLTIDLHLHSTASDGECPPADVVARAGKAGLSAIALTDHDTLDGVPAAVTAGELLGVRVIGGCEFSVQAPWGEMHLLGYYLSPSAQAVEEFLVGCRSRREQRGRVMVERLQALGVPLEVDDMLSESAGGAVGRPHVARALVRRGFASGVNDAFDRYLGRGRPAFVEKMLPAFREVAALVHAAGGLVSAAHLKDRASLTVLRKLKVDGLDGVEIRHPSHSPEIRARLTEYARRLELLTTGGSDWHGDGAAADAHAPLGSEQVPGEWLERLDAAWSGNPARLG